MIEQTAKYLEQVRELVKDVNQFWAYSFVRISGFLHTARATDRSIQYGKDEAGM